ncbi:MAG: peptidoglycan-binding protein [Leptothrix sp. (in: Bacteria)]|nr:peptidoglycan-binding protein [Leptothrix sp. (in: b-proteobacteria)]
MARFVGDAEPLSKAGFEAAVATLGVGMPEVVSVLKVESKSCGFLPSRRPKILYERHIFHRLTGGRFSDANPDVSNPMPGGYAGDEREYPRLEKAARLDREAALKSASWGAGQVMGMNHQMVGFDDVETMVAAMQVSEDEQLMAVVNFIKSRRLDGALRAHDWAAFARGYNGAAYAKNKYDLMLNAKYNEVLAGTLPDLDVRAAQLYLTYLGYALGDIDGLYGRKSRAAVVNFKLDNGLSGGERIDRALLAALRAKVHGA